MITILILIIPVILFGQFELTEESSMKLSQSNDYIISDFDEKEIENFLEEQKMKINLQAGAIFGAGFGSGEYFGTYIAPQFNYRLSPKFILKTGVVLYQSFGNLNYEAPESGFGYPSANYSISLIYASGSYQLNKRLILSGTVYKEVNLFNQNNNAHREGSYEIQGMIMGVDYKVGKNILIQGQIEISNNPNPGYSYPNSYFGNGFENNTFGRYPPF